MAKSDVCLEDIERALTRVVRTLHLPRVHERLSEAAGVSLERTGYGVLGRIAEAGTIRPSELAAVLGLDISTVSRQVQDLESKGLVERRPDPADGRASVLNLTPRGDDAFAKLRAARRSLLEAIVHDWPARDRDELARLLAKFGDGLNMYTEAR